MTRQTGPHATKTKVIGRPQDVAVFQDSGAISWVEVEDGKVV